MADFGIIMHAIPLSASRNGHRGSMLASLDHSSCIRVSLRKRRWVTNCIAVLVCAQILVFCSCLVAGLWFTPSRSRNVHPKTTTLWLLEELQGRAYKAASAQPRSTNMTHLMFVSPFQTMVSTWPAGHPSDETLPEINILQIQSLQIHPYGTHGITSSSFIHKREPYCKNIDRRHLLDRVSMFKSE